MSCTKFPCSSKVWKFTTINPKLQKIGKKMCSYMLQNIHTTQLHNFELKIASKNTILDFKCTNTKLHTKICIILALNVVLFKCTFFPRECT